MRLDQIDNIPDLRVEFLAELRKAQTPRGGGRRPNPLLLLGGEEEQHLRRRSVEVVKLLDRIAHFDPKSRTDANVLKYQVGISVFGIEPRDLLDLVVK